MRIVFVLLLLAACGIKGDPLPPTGEENSEEANDIIVVQ